MIGAPRLYSVGRTLESLGQSVETLEAKLHRHMTFIFAQYLVAEIILEILADNKDNLSKSGFDGIED